MLYVYSSNTPLLYTQYRGYIQAYLVMLPLSLLREHIREYSSPSILAGLHVVYLSKCHCAAAPVLVELAPNAYFVVVTNFVRWRC